jgi:hypothetical protein
MISREVFYENFNNISSLKEGKLFNTERLTEANAKVV